MWLAPGGEARPLRQPLVYPLRHPWDLHVFLRERKPSLRNPQSQARGHMLLRVRAGIQAPTSRHWVQKPSTPHLAPHKCALLLAHYATSSLSLPAAEPLSARAGQGPLLLNNGPFFSRAPLVSRTPELRTLLPRLPWPQRAVAASRYLQSTPLPVGCALLTKGSRESVLWTATCPLLGCRAHLPGPAWPQQARQ